MLMTFSSRHRETSNNLGGRRRANIRSKSCTNTASRKAVGLRAPRGRAEWLDRSTDSLNDGEVDRLGFRRWRLLARRGVIGPVQCSQEIVSSASDRCALLLPCCSFSTHRPSHRPSSIHRPLSLTLPSITIPSRPAASHSSRATISRSTCSEGANRSWLWVSVSLRRTRMVRFAWTLQAFCPRSLLRACPTRLAWLLSVPAAAVGARRLTPFRSLARAATQ